MTTVVISTFANPIAKYEEMIYSNQMYKWVQVISICAELGRLIDSQFDLDVVKRGNLIRKPG